MSTNISSTCGFGWSVKVFRHTQERGWESVEASTLVSPFAGGIDLWQFRVKLKLHRSCVRRRNLIHLSTRRAGSIVLQFPSTADCLDFWDELVRCKHPNRDASAPTDKMTAESTAGSQTEENLTRQQQDTLSYLARLLHDPDFGRFVQQIEQMLKSTPDGTKMLEAWEAHSQEEL
jgi:hypothetical protein